MPSIHKTCIIVLKCLSLTTEEAAMTTATAEANRVDYQTDPSRYRH